MSTIVLRGVKLRFSCNQLPVTDSPFGTIALLDRQMDMRDSIISMTDPGDKEYGNQC